MKSFAQFFVESKHTITDIVKHSIKHSGYTPDALCSGGRCYEFADKVKEKARRLGHDVHVIDSHEWVRNHERYGGKIGWAEENNLYDNNHAWIFHNGKHYDALNPEGVDRPRNLQFFKDSEMTWHRPTKDDKEYVLRTTGKKYSREDDEFK